jgi:hypothetical protein
MVRKSSIHFIDFFFFFLVFLKPSQTKHTRGHLSQSVPVRTCELALIVKTTSLSGRKTGRASVLTAKPLGFFSDGVGRCCGENDERVRGVDDREPRGGGEAREGRGEGAGPRRPKHLQVARRRRSRWRSVSSLILALFGFRDFAGSSFFGENVLILSGPFLFVV